jgi:tRNA nucleotidyltransferase (CCA-adding enzyme)
LFKVKKGKNMQNEIEELTSEILGKITPTKGNRAKMEALARELECKVACACEEFGVKAVVRLEGSVAKDTWLSEEPDVDVFMRLPTAIPRTSLGEISLKIAKKATEGFEQIERFAEHPYLEAFVEKTRVNIVPCYETKIGEWLSATDRTPFHTDYINKHLRKNMHGEVRLLKKFMKGINVYGAEIKVGGFSGYLCELLVLHYGSFVETLKAFAAHVPRRVIDIEGYYEQRNRELDLLFPELLVMIDPVDMGRNVASAVQPQKLHLFVGAVRVFLKTPNKDFFYPPKIRALSPMEVKVKLEKDDSALVFLTLGGVNAVSDVLWGQLYKTRRSLGKLLELSDFNVLRDAVWSDHDGASIVFLFELEQRMLPYTKMHIGPPLDHEKECESFLTKYVGNGNVVAGPYIDEGRWIVELKRKCTDAVELLRAKMAGGGREVGVAELMAKALREDFKILFNSEVLDIYVVHEGFAEFLTTFLLGQPFWLKQYN